MALRSGGRKLSFEILAGKSQNLDDDDYYDDDESLLLRRSNSDPIRNSHGREHQSSGASDSSHHKLGRKKRRKRKKPIPIAEDSIADYGLELGNRSEAMELSRAGFGVSTVVYEEVEGVSESVSSPVAFHGVVRSGELRQRSVNGVISDSDGAEAKSEEASSTMKPNGGVTATKLETVESLDWNRLIMADDPNNMFPTEQSPLKYFMDDIFGGHSLRNTTPPGDEKERERVYDTIFRLPWRCELLINVGFFVCFDSFLSLLTIMPARIMMSFWRLLKSRQFKRPSPDEVSDFGCFIVMAIGVTLLERTDISLIYHMIRGQGTIKLYVVYNVLEIFDKLCQSFNGDVLQTLFKSAEGLANSTQENMCYWIWRYMCDQALAVAASIIHSFILLAQAITLSTCIVAHNNALLALLVSNNFGEIKSNVFKRFSKDNIHSMVYFDSVERFHISAYILFVLAQNILEAEGPWFESFLFNAFMVYVCEMLIDIIKHSFIAKFNGIKPIAYSEYLEDLCKQTLNIQSDSSKTTLTFIPLAPACVVIRVLTPVYSALIPSHPLPWKLFTMALLFLVTYVMLTSLKILIRTGLQKHATWYINRCRKRKHHLHSD